MKQLVLTKGQARQLLLKHQGLNLPREFSGKTGVLDFIRRVGCIQYDALNIVGRNPELVLQARIPDFRHQMLYELLYEERRLLDGPDKEMSIYCVEDWPYFRRRRQQARDRFGNSSRPIMPFLPQVRRKIEEHDPLSSSDLDFNQMVDWPWAPTRLSRAALESMYLWGELVIHHKENTRKVYDFSHRHVAERLLKAPEPNETEAEYHDWYVLRRVGAVGLLWGKSGDALRDIHGMRSEERRASIARLLKQRKLLEFKVEGIKYPLYMRATDKDSIGSATESARSVPQAAILAPLDNLLWDRDLVKALFDFEYRWEVYKPVKERQYGYYVLPVLYGDRFIARFEPGRDKEQGALLIKNWWWEPGIAPSADVSLALNHCFERFLEYLGCKRLEAEKALVEREGLDWLRSGRMIIP